MGRPCPSRQDEIGAKITAARTGREARRCERCGWWHVVQPGTARQRRAERRRAERKERGGGG